MRGAFIQKLLTLAETDPRIFLLTGDLGYMVLEPFAKRFPERFINVGVAEQNMVGLATGLAESGFLPFVYSIVTFATLRPYEFIRNGPILHKLPVRIAGVGGGMEYGHNGVTHYGLEDIAVMRAQPGITVIAPADSGQAITALEKTWDLPGPIYYRLGKDDKVTVPGLNAAFELGKAQLIREGADILLIAMGSVSSEVIAASELLAQTGIASSVMIVASINPAPIYDLETQLRKFRTVMTVEAHYLAGGLGSLVSEIIAEKDLTCKLTRIAVKESLNGVTGSQQYLYRKFGLSKECLTTTARTLLNGVVA